jgi:hypothetical protein
MMQKASDAGESVVPPVGDDRVDVGPGVVHVKRIELAGKSQGRLRHTQRQIGSVRRRKRRELIGADEHERQPTRVPRFRCPVKPTLIVLLYLQVLSWSFNGGNMLGER